MNNQITNFYAQKFFKDNPDGFAPKKKATKKNFSASTNKTPDPAEDGKGSYMKEYLGFTTKDNIDSCQLWQWCLNDETVKGDKHLEKAIGRAGNVYDKCQNPKDCAKKGKIARDLMMTTQPEVIEQWTKNLRNKFLKYQASQEKGHQASQEKVASNDSKKRQASQEKIAANYSRRNYGLGNAVAGGVSKVGTVIGNVNKALVPNAKCSLDNSIEFNKIISDYLTNIVNTHGNDPKVCTQLINNAKKEILNVLDGCKKTMHVLGKNFSRKDAARIRMYAKHRNYNLASNMQAIVNQSKAIGNSALTAAKSGTSAAISAAENAFTAVNGTIRGIFSGDILPKVSDTVEKIRLSCGGDTKYCDQMIDMLKKEVIHNCDVAEKAVKLTAKTAKRSLA